ncbi:DUF4065 domain-containing protein [Paraclostridium sordellii 8483]|uniref:Panacea domain-containing protein n=1 Tax=Paraclostridium sordellii TaxID=1505 RepID=UPI0002D552CA|nr:type II toxin-antitoxin system antitoxin SocA domain-containing protein [Paeniclostridium sordellii]TAN66821.1 DUF4065 domain-containing protein [Paeniclostridium sordellii 8483]
MYNVLEVAQHVVNKSIEIEKPVTHLKLQKMLYYIQAAFLVEHGEPCFNKEFENWKHGPVVPEIYSEYRRYMNKPIKEVQEETLEMYINTNFSLSVRRIKYNKNDFKKCDLELIDKVIDSYQDENPWDMVKKTHEEDPWKETYKDEIITKESIREFFIKNKHRIYGEAYAAATC